MLPSRKYRPGLITIEGKLVKGVRIEDADAAVKEELRLLMEQGITEQELEKVKNKTESAMAFEDMSLLNRASSIAMYELLGDANLINTELSRYHSVSAADILQASRKILTKKMVIRCITCLIIKPLHEQKDRPSYQGRHRIPAQPKAL